MTILPTANRTWSRCRVISDPRPENYVEFFEFKEADERKMSVTPGSWVIQGQWGETIDGVQGLERLVDGDFICRQPNQHTDQWVVRRKLFLDTYTELRE